jgi:hypothetical protein
MATNGNIELELDVLRAYYDTHDTSAEMGKGEWVQPDRSDPTVGGEGVGHMPAP